MIYRTPLHRRLALSERRRRRYRDDPVHRLAKINANRRMKGLPEVASVDEIGCDLSAIARQRTRDARGRFV